MSTKLQNGKIPYLTTLNSNPRLTVLVLDSGVGGLSVYNEIWRLLPDLHYIYVFDNIAFPYGEKEEAFVINRVIRIVSAVQKRYPLALAVIACNTASTISLPNLRKKFLFPIIGVVPDIKPAVHLTMNSSIGLLATRRTVESSYTQKLVNQFANKCQISMLSSAELVEIAEAKIHGSTVSLNDLRLILRPWLCMTDPPDTIVLGCTHFPLLQDELLQVLPKGTRLVHSGAYVARHAAWMLKHEALNAKSFDTNVVFCLAVTQKTKQLLPIFHLYGFKKIEELVL